jgi:hypothetical protein
MLIVFKVSIRHFLICFTCIAGFIMGAQTLAPVAHAAGGTITLTMPNNAALLGHVGTQIQIAGAGLTPATAYNLYTTTNNDPAACSAQNVAQMASFTTNPTVTTNVTGAFQLTTTWPGNAANATTAYFVCAVPPNGILNAGGAGTLSTQSFTVAQSVTLAVSAQTVQPGGNITVSGTGWVPPQAISVSIIGSSGTLANQTVPGNQVTPTQGSFSVQFALPASTAPGSYTVKAFAVNEQTQAMQATQQFTVAQQATATPTQQATNTPTQQATSTPVTHTTGNGGGGGGMNILIFGLGGLGAVLVIIGITVYVVYSRKGQPTY